MLQTDTLRLDSAYIEAWRQADDFDYNRELMSSQRNLLQWLWQQFTEALKKLLPDKMPEETETVIDIFCAVAIVALIVWVVIKLKPRFFARKEEIDKNFTLEEDTIYGVDFEQLLADARRQQNHREVVRLLYLQTLRRLSDAHLIDWQPFKTPTQYTGEYPALRQMTNSFLLVRYGNRDATAAMADEMAVWQQGIYSQLDADAAPSSSEVSTPQQKGGES